jgi:hypothetical protein
MAASPTDAPKAAATATRSPGTSDSPFSRAAAAAAALDDDHAGGKEQAPPMWTKNTLFCDLAGAREPAADAAPPPTAAVAPPTCAVAQAAAPAPQPTPARRCSDLAAAAAVDALRAQLHSEAAANAAALAEAQRILAEVQALLRGAQSQAAAEVRCRGCACTCAGLLTRRAYFRKGCRAPGGGGEPACGASGGGRAARARAGGHCTAGGAARCSRRRC